MADTFRVTVDGEEYEVDADSLPQARAKAYAAAAAFKKDQGAKQEAERPGAGSRFVGGVWKNVNPVMIAQGLFSTAIHPFDTARNVGAQMGEQWQKAGEEWNGNQIGHTSAAIGHALAGSIPFIGPAAAAAAERIGSGDVAGGLGEGAGLAAPVLLPRAARAAGKAIDAVAPGVADSLQAGAEARVSDLMSPKVGANKVRLGNTARRVAPELLEDMKKEGAPLTREGFHQQIQTKLEQAAQELDDAAAARGSTNLYSVGGIIRALQAKRAALEVRGVVPGPNAARAAVIDQAINELQQVGALSEYNPLKTMRQAYDQQAKPVYSPAVTPDYLKAHGAAQGAADVAGVLREKLAAIDPSTAEANSKYALYKAADDVLRATQETEAARPRVGRQIVSRLTGTVAGASTGNPGAVVAGYLGGPLIDHFLLSGVTTRLKTAALMSKLAEEIRAGNLSGVYSTTLQLKMLGATAAAAEGNAAPSGAATAPTQAVPATP